MTADLDRLLSALAVTIAAKVPAEQRRTAVDGIARRISAAVKRGDDPQAAITAYIDGQRPFALSPARRQTLAALRRTARKARA